MDTNRLKKTLQHLLPVFAIRLLPRTYPRMLRISCAHAFPHCKRLRRVLLATSPWHMPMLALAATMPLSPPGKTSPATPLSPVHRTGASAALTVTIARISKPPQPI
jgi:hypothetical protein